jgi:hypothetical protein
MSFDDWCIYTYEPKWISALEEPKVLWISTLSNA